MEKRKSIEEEVGDFQVLDNARISIDQKLNELLELLEHSKLDSVSVSQIKAKFNDAVERVELSTEGLKKFEALDHSTASRLELAENLEILLSQYQVDSKVSRKVTFTDGLMKAAVVIIGLILITLGFGMIIMPAPPYFEMFTIFYFSIDNGVTLMDLIALLIVFTGVYLFISSLVKINRLEHVR